MSKSEISRPIGTDGKGIMGSDNTNPLNNLEKIAMNGLDEDKAAVPPAIPNSTPLWVVNSPVRWTGWS